MRPLSSGSYNLFDLIYCHMALTMRALVSSCTPRIWASCWDKMKRLGDCSSSRSTFTVNFSYAGTNLREIYRPFSWVARRAFDHYTGWYSSVCSKWKLAFEKNDKKGSFVPCALPKSFRDHSASVCSTTALIARMRLV